MAHKTDAQFRAEGDANTLGEAEAIKATPTRLRQAKAAAKQLATEQEKRARGMRKVASGRVKKTTAQRRKRR